MNMTIGAIISLILTCIGSTILTVGFIPQAKAIYKRKTVTGLSIISWGQNLAGRIFFVIYLMLMNASRTTQPSFVFTIISQCLIGIMSIPLIYYLVRNRKTDGKYKKEDFNKALFAGRMLLLVIMVSVFVVALLGSFHVFRIPLFNPETPDAKQKYPLLIIGTLSAVVVSSAFFAQSFKIFKSKVTKNNSLGLTVMFMIGNTLLAFSFIAFVIEGLIHNDTFPLVSKIGPIIMILLGVTVMGGVLSIKIKNIKNGIDEPTTITITPSFLVKKGEAAKATRLAEAKTSIEKTVKTEKKK